VRKTKILVGVPGSGKSTVARQFVDKGYVQLERDLIRMELYGVWYGGGIDENKVTAVQVERARRALLAGKSIVISDTCINPETRNKWIHFCSSMGSEVDVIHVGGHLLLDDLIERNRNRDDQSKVVDDKVVTRFYTEYREQFPLQKADYSNASVPKAFVFDIDGTLANMEGVRGPFDWKKVGKDAPYEDVIQMTRDLCETGHEIIVVSGRDGVCREETQQWLDDNDVICDQLLMRPAGSQVRDSIIKHDIYHRDIAPFYNVRGVFDDRNQVVAMWRAMGLRCYQVQLGNF
jgi:predicted kinase